MKDSKKIEDTIVDIIGFYKDATPEEMRDTLDKLVFYVKKEAIEKIRSI